MTLPDLLHRLREEEGHAEDTLVEGEVNLIPLFRHRPVCSDSNMSNRLSKIHTFLAGSKASGPCVCFKENAEERISIASSTHALDSVH